MKIVFGNLKMNFLYKEYCSYLNELEKFLEQEQPKTILGIAVPYIFLDTTAKKFGSSFNVIAQDVHYAESGAFTSSISAGQVASININWTIIGHSECREMNQTNEVIIKKIRMALFNNLNIVYCCGKEPLKEIRDELSFLNVSDLQKIIIAFEPVASIGSGKPMNEILACKHLEEIKLLLIKMWGKAGENIKLLYGGSVNNSNYKNYLDQDIIDGILIGGASLKAEQLWNMATLK